MRRWIVLLTVAMLIVVSGCAAPPKRELSTELADYTGLPNGHDPLNPSEFRHDSQHGDLYHFERVHGRPLTILQLSGGGQNGAFGAGVLVGWAESGTRPQFDIVTGISTGALMATFAFLGTPEDDRTLEALYTEITASDVYRRRSRLSLLGGTNSLLDTKPLARLIEKHMTMETMQRVANEHEKGRRLAIGTTNLDYAQIWYWSLGEIATQRSPEALELYRELLLAAASPPVVFPPVEIDGHLLADGAVIDNLMIVGLFAPRDDRPTMSGATGKVYNIHNGRLTFEPGATANRLKGLIARSVAINMNHGMGASLLRAYFVASVHGYDYYLLQIPPAVEMGENPLAFDQDEIRRLFAVGRELGRRPRAWARVPPTTQQVAPWLRDAVGRIREAQ